MKTNLKNLIKKANFNYVNNNITETNFLDDGVFEPEKIELLKFDKEMTSEEVLVEEEKQGLRPANARELIAWAKKGWNGEDDVVALGQKMILYGDLRVLYLWSNDGYRMLSLGSSADGWDRYCRFAFIKKSFATNAKAIQTLLSSEKKKYKDEAMKQYGLGQQEGIEYGKEKALNELLKKMPKEVKLSNGFLRRNQIGYNLAISKIKKVIENKLKDK